MILDAAVDGTAHRVEVTGGGGKYTVRIDGRPLTVDWREVQGPFASLMVLSSPEMNSGSLVKWGGLSGPPRTPPEGSSHHVGIEPRAGGYRVLVGSDEFVVDLLESTPAASDLARRAPSGPARLVAPMPGRIVRVLAEAGQQVEAGQGLVVMEAMKMENELRAPRAGRVAEMHALEGRTVETGALLAVVE